MEKPDTQKYFANKDAEKLATYMLSYADGWYNEAENFGYLDKLRMCWAAYHGAYYTDFSDGHQISFGGEHGELAEIGMNHTRNIAKHMLSMVTSSRPSLQAKAINTDHKSLVQARLANGLLEYYMREKRLEDDLRKATQYAIVLGAGFIKLEWNETSGEVYDYNEDTNTEVRGGDVESTVLDPFNVIFDSSREDQKHTWVLCRTFVERHALMAKYPEMADKISQLPSKADLQSAVIESTFFKHTDLIPVYEFYHKRNESLEDGRYTMFLDSNVVLLDGPLPYRELPVYRIAPDDILGSPYGYSPLFDLLPLQDAVNTLHSSILTNQSTFAVQNLFVPRGADIGFAELSGGLNIIEGNAKPEPINFTATPREVFEYAQTLERSMETISGINSVTRGNPESSLKSGTALALVQSNSLTYMSGLQQSYIRLIEDVGTGLLNILKDYASVPRVAAIAGKKNKNYMEQEFVGEDLSMINRVVVDVGNPLADTVAGRVQMAEQLLQMKLIKTPEQYFQVINSGKLDVMTEDTQGEIDLIKKENESLVAGEMVIATPIDQHTMHIKEHRSVLSDPELRKDPELLQRVLDHIQEHIDFLRNTDADLLAIIQEQPLGPPAGTPINPQQNPNLPDQPLQQMNPANMQAADVMSMQQSPRVNGTNLPTPPAPFQNAPITPEDLG